MDITHKAAGYGTIANYQVYTEGTKITRYIYNLYGYKLHVLEQLSVAHNKEDVWTVDMM